MKKIKTIGKLYIIKKIKKIKKNGKNIFKKIKKNINIKKLNHEFFNF